MEYTTKEIQGLLGTAKYLPTVSIIAAFQPQMSSRSEIEYRLKTYLKNVERELLTGYPAEKAMPVILKMRNLLASINYTCFKKSIAIFASPVTEKVFYMDIPVEDKIIANGSFEVRDLVYARKQNNQYLLFVISSTHAKTFLGEGSSLKCIKSNSIEQSLSSHGEQPEKVSNFSDPDARRQTIADKFLRQMDNGLGLILKSYALPVFLMGVDKTISHFRQITRHASHIVLNISGNYIDSTLAQLGNVLKPYLSDWETLRHQTILQQLEKAMDDGRLAKGIKQVWEAATHKRGRLLVLESGLNASADDSFPDIAGRLSNLGLSAHHIRSIVDDIIEKTLLSGGDVEFVDSGELKHYQQIALIEYY